MSTQKAITTKASNTHGWLSRIASRVSRIEPATFLLAIAIPFGLLLCFLTPPFQVPDEQAHFARAYQISQGGILPERINGGVGGNLPYSLNEISQKLIGNIPGNTNNKANADTIFETLSHPLNPDHLTQLHFENTAIYSPVMYAPGAVAIAASRTAGATPLVMLYVSRVFTLLATVALLYLAVRLVPIAKWAFVAIALTPMAIFQAASVSADAMTLGIVFVAVAWFVRLARQSSPVTSKQWIAKLSFVLVLGFLKQPYALLGLIYAALPARIFVTQVARWKFIASVLGVLAIGAVSWYFVSKGYFAQSPFLIDRVLQPDAQLSYIVGHPFEFAKLVVFTHVTGFGDTIIPQMIGVFGWLDTPLPIWVTVTYLGVLAVAFGTSNAQPKIGTSQRLTLLAAAALAVLAIDVILYMFWNALGAPVLHGIQGRYYLALLPFIAVAMAGAYSVRFARGITNQCVIMGGIVVAHIMTVFILIQRFY